MNATALSTRDPIGEPHRADVDDRLDAIAGALADRTRRGLLRLVRDDERTAGALAAAFPTISRPAVSQHLRVLHDAGLVTVRPDGNHRWYRAEVEALAPVTRFVDDLWVDRLQRLKRVAESGPDDGSAR